MDINSSLLIIFSVSKVAFILRLSWWFSGLQVDDEAMDLNKELMSKLLELDDVDAVYTDQK